MLWGGLVRLRCRAVTAETQEDAAEGGKPLDEREDLVSHGPDLSLDFPSMQRACAPSLRRVALCRRSFGSPSRCPVGSLFMVAWWLIRDFG